jgi:squalene synthase HpnD
MTTLTAEPTISSPAPAAQAAAGSSFYAGMRVLPRTEREAMYAVYGFCRTVDDIADDQSLPVEVQRGALQAWREDIEALYAGRDPGRARMLQDPVRRYQLDKQDFLALIDGMQMDLEGLVAPDLETLYLYCDRAAVAVGRLSIRIFGIPAAAGGELAHHLGRALQLTNILRDVDEDAAMGRLYLPREYLEDAGVLAREPQPAVLAPGVERACERLCQTAQGHFQEARRVLGRRPPGHLAAPRLMAAVYSDLLSRLRHAGWAPPRPRVRAPKSALVWILVRHGLLG